MGEHKLTRRPVYENDTFKMGEKSDLNACVGNNGFIDLYTYHYSKNNSGLTSCRIS